MAKQTSQLLQQNLGRDLDQYSGNLVADFIPEMLRARGMIGEGFDTSLDSRTLSVLKEALEGTPSYNLSPEITKERFEKTVRNPLLRTFDEEIAPRISEGFAGRGATFSSRRGDANRKALEGLQANMASELADMNYRNQALRAQLAESATERQLASVGMGQQFAGRNLARAGALMQAAAPFQQQEQEKLSGKYQEFLRTRSETSPYLNAALAFTGQPHMSTYYQEASPGFDWGSLLNTGIGAGAMLGGAYLGGAAGLKKAPSMGVDSLVNAVPGYAPTSRW